MKLSVEFRNVDRVVKKFKVALCIFVSRGSEFAIEGSGHISRLILALKGTITLDCFKIYYNYSSHSKDYPLHKIDPTSNILCCSRQVF